MTKTISTYDEYVAARYTQEYTPSREELPDDQWTKKLPPEPVEPTTHDLQIAHCIVEYGAKPKRDMARINAYLRLRAERARRAKAVQANPVGPRTDEWAGIEKPNAITQGAVNPCATGCLPIPWVDPKLQPLSIYRPSVPKPDSKPETVKPIEVEGTFIGTSAIGAKPVNRHAALPCGPTPILYQAPNESNLTKGDDAKEELCGRNR